MRPHSSIVPEQYIALGEDIRTVVKHITEILKANWTPCTHDQIITEIQEREEEDDKPMYMYIQCAYHTYNIRNE